MSTGDEREALKTIIYTYETIDFAESQNFTTRDCYGVVDAILAAGYRRQGPITDAQVEAAATQMYAIEHLGESRLPDDWEGALFKRRARAVLESAREAS
jgi:hypothetical protein